MPIPEASIKNLLKTGDERICFHFLMDLQDDQALLTLRCFYEKNRRELGQAAKTSAAFSSLWRAYYGGESAGIAGAYQEISGEMAKGPCAAKQLSQKMSRKFLEKLKIKGPSAISKAKRKWLKKLQFSPVYNNQKLCRFLLFLCLNRRRFDKGWPRGGGLRGGGRNILTLTNWLKEESYKIAEPIISQSERPCKTGPAGAIGNLILVSESLHSQLSNRSYISKRKALEKFCKKNKGKHALIEPIIFNHKKNFGEEEAAARSLLLAGFLWKELAEKRLKLA